MATLMTLLSTLIAPEVSAAPSVGEAAAPAAAAPDLAAPDLAAADPAVRHLTVRGTRLTYVDSGSGEPVVAVHGALSDLRIWSAFPALLSEDYRFVAYNQRHFGPPGDRRAAVSMSREDHVEDLLAFVDELGVGPVHLVTWSYGGDVGTRALLRRPDRFRSLVQFDPSVGALLSGLPEAQQVQGEYAETFQAALAALEEGRLEDAAYRFAESVAQLPAGGAHGEPEPLPTMIRDNARTLAPLLSLPPGEPISCEQLGAIDTPVLVIHGERSHGRYRLIAERLAACLGNARLEVMPGVGHDGPYRDPEGFARLLRAFHRR